MFAPSGVARSRRRWRRAPPFLRGLRAKSRGEGPEEGRAKQRTLLCRQAALRFDAATAEPLAVRLADIDDLAVLASAADWVVLCASGAELLARLPRPCDTR